jgi:non-canonical purine NTP pyrophosphatase (RdgB/HAM1 family)
MTGPRLLAATRNEHKLRELREALPGFEIDALPADVELPPETGATFAENALAKARAAHAATGRTAVADDSGIEAAALGGAPGPRSARYAGDGASDEANLTKLMHSLEGEDDRRVAYVCALALVTAGGGEQLFEARCEGDLAGAPRGTGGFGYDPAFVPRATGPDDPRTMAELTPGEKQAISHRGQAARMLADHLGTPPPAAVRMTGKPRAAAVSIVSNAALIGLKVVVGVVTGSIAILTEALHSAIDLVASVIAFFSVRYADEPADQSHPYGHEKVENLAAVIEGMLIIVGAVVIVYEASRRLGSSHSLDHLGLGIGVVALSIVVNLVVSGYLGRRAAQYDSAALQGDAAHLRADAVTSVGVLAALALVEVTGETFFDPAVALVVAVAIVVAGFRILNRSSRVLVDEVLPRGELDAIEEAIARARAPEVAGYHKLRARQAGSRRHIDLHVQFRPGTSLERAHTLAHELKAAISSRISGADVLIHLEPEGSRTGGDEPPTAG